MINCNFKMEEIRVHSNLQRQGIWVRKILTELAKVNDYDTLVVSALGSAVNIAVYAVTTIEHRGMCQIKKIEADQTGNGAPSLKFSI